MYIATTEGVKQKYIADKNIEHHLRLGFRVDGG